MSLKNKKASLIPILVIISTFLWSQFLWAYGIPLQNEVSSKPEEIQKNLPNNIQYTFSKEFSSFPRNSQILTKNNPENSALETLENNLISSLKEPTGEVLSWYFWQILPPNSLSILSFMWCVRPIRPHLRKAR